MMFSYLAQGFNIRAYLISVTLFFASCSSSAPSMSLPPWVLKTPIGCGMGSVRVSGSLSIAKTGAIARGRDALARELQTRVESVMRTYQAEGGETLSEEVLLDVSQQSSRAMLRGTRDRELFVSDGDPKVLYALVCYEPSQRPSFVKSLAKLPSVSREPIRQKAEASFAELEALMESY